MALVWTAALMAQRIAVVDSNGSTQIFNTLQAAIEGAADGSVVYLPGGGFSIADSVKITKKLTIIGIGHYVESDNADGITTISGSLYYDNGSSGSAVMGCYITGSVWIGKDGSSVNDILIKYCNLNSVHIYNSICLGTIVNQNYIRSHVCPNNDDNYATAEVTNNIVSRIHNLEQSLIANNIIIYNSTYDYKAMSKIKDSVIKDNIFLCSGSYYPCSSISNTMLSGNMGFLSGLYSGFVDENYIYMSGISKDDVFVKCGDVSPASDFHFKDEYKQYENQVGIYAGDGFSDDQLPPVPYIVEKHIDQQTDASGHLNVRIRVKAGGTE